MKKMRHFIELKMGTKASEEDKCCDQEDLGTGDHGCESYKD